MCGTVIFYMRSSRGFTLIELLTTISIIGLLSSVIFASLNSSRDNSRLAAAKQLDANFQHAIGDQRVGAWLFDEGAGTTAGNLDPTTYTATFNGGVAWDSDTPYSHGYSLSFTASSYVQLDNINGGTYAVVPGTVRTYTVWFKDRGSTGTNQAILWKEGNCTGPSLVMNATGNVYGQFNSSATGACPAGETARVTSTNTYSADNKWHFAALTIDRVNNKLSFYVDGAIVGSTGMSATNLMQGMAFRVGNNWNGSAYFNGLIDDVRVYTSNLTLTQIEKMYAEGLVRHGLADASGPR